MSDFAKGRAAQRQTIKDQAAEITRLRAELATARRGALAEIKQDTDELIEQGRQDGMEQAAQILEECYRCSQRGFPERYRAGLAAGAQVIAAAIRAAALDPAVSQAAADLVATARRETEQERDEFFNRLGRITEYLDLPVDATAQRIIETIRERVENEREACASVEVRLTVPEGAETWTPLEAWEEALLAFDEAFRDAIRAAAGEVK